MKRVTITSAPFELNRIMRTKGAGSWEIELACHSQFWNLQAIDELVDEKISKDGWEAVQESLTILPDATPYGPVPRKREEVLRTPAFHVIYAKTPWAIYDPDRTRHLGDGRVEDIRHHILGLDTVPGLFVDPSVLQELKPTSLEDLREQFEPIAHDLLSTQIEEGHTFFLSQEKMRDSPFIKHIPRLLNTRLEEIQRLPKEPKLQDIFRSYYGFKLITESGADGKAAVEAFCEFSASHGKDIVPPKETLSVPPREWSNEPVPFSSSLLSILLAVQGPPKFRVEHTGILGQIQDSKALDALHARVLHSGMKLERLRLLEAIGEIGRPESFEVLSSLLDDQTLWPAVFMAMSCIRHPGAYDAIEPYMSETGWFKEMLFALARTRDERAVKYLEDSLSDDDYGVIEAAIDGLVLFGPKGLDVLQRYMKHPHIREYFEDFFDLEL
ncbi:MAG: HEAT repeat domain-containing protein [Candidatus Thorarchaeota archaeon]